MLASVLALLLAQISETSTPETPGAMEVVEVRSARLEAHEGASASISGLQEDVIALERPTHPNEIFDRVPGAWIIRGSGQEHLTALRSPVLTGPGACGAFLVLENDVPIRPAGFCNVNELFEVNLLQAQEIEVLRGPGTVIYGSNALHGAISVRSRDPEPGFSRSIGIEVGTDDYYRGALSLGSERFAFSANITDAGSFRVDERYAHAQLNLNWRHDFGEATGITRFSWADLDQDTAGFILGKDAYKDSALRVQNLNPEAFRKGRAARLASTWTWQRAGGAVFELIPYARTSNMDFLQHFLPGTPLERNGQDSAGLLFSWTDQRDWAAGLDFEWADGFLSEFQAVPVSSGSAFLRETRPQGFHYAYEVDALSFAGWAQKSLIIKEKQKLIAGLRAEWIEFDYDNNMRDGNTRDDGTECGFGGCLYTRPSDRSDSFFNLAPELGLDWSMNGNRALGIRLSRGFRAPQVTELYRLQSGQSVADLDVVTTDSLEVTLSDRGERWAYDLAAYTMRKDNFIFRDAEGFNVSDGKTRHTGIEFDVAWQPSERVGLGADLSWANHEYDFDRDLARGEVIRSGSKVDTAPEWLGALRLNWAPAAGREVEAEWVYTGDYYLDASNRHLYEGHGLLNLSGSVTLGGGSHRLGFKVTNILDEEYAERADFAFGNYRYFPGAGRRFSINWELRIP